MLAFITEAGAKSVVMTDRIIGCPHEGTDRWTGKLASACRCRSGAARLNEWRTFFGRAVLYVRQIEPVPMNEVGITGIVDDIDPDRPTLPNSKDRSGH